MKKLTLTLLTCLIFLSPNVVMSETMKDLTKSEGRWFPHFSKVPFTGKVTGHFRGLIKNGKKEGEWVDYGRDGAINSERAGTFKNGKKISN